MRPIDLIHGSGSGTQIDCEEDRTGGAVLIGMLREMDAESWRLLPV